MSPILALVPPLAVMLLLTLMPTRMLALALALVFLFHESSLHFVHQS